MQPAHSGRLRHAINAGTSFDPVLACGGAEALPHSAHQTLASDWGRSCHPWIRTPVWLGAPPRS